MPSRWSPRVPSSLGARGASRRSGDVGECAGPRPLGARALSPVVRVVRRGCLSRCETLTLGRSRGGRLRSFCKRSFGASARLSRRGDPFCRRPPRASTKRSCLSGIRPGNRFRGHTRIAVKRQGELWSLRVPPPVARRVRRCVRSEETFAVTPVPIDGCRRTIGLPSSVRSAARVPPRGDRPSEEPRESAPFARRVRGSSRASVRWFVLSGRQRRSRLRRRDPEVLHRVLVRCSADARVLRSSRPSFAPLVSERHIPTGEHRGSRSRFARSLHRTCPCRSPARSRSDRVAEPVTPSTRWVFGRRAVPRSLSRSSCPRSSPSRASDVEILSGASHRPSRRPVHIAALSPFTSTASITRSHLLVRGRDEHPALSSGLVRPWFGQKRPRRCASVLGDHREKQLPLSVTTVTRGDGSREVCCRGLLRASHPSREPARRGAKVPLDLVRRARRESALVSRAGLCPRRARFGGLRALGRCLPLGPHRWGPCFFGALLARSLGCRSAPARRDRGWIVRERHCAVAV